MSDDQALINLANRVRSNHCEPGTDRSAYLLAVNVLNRLAALSAPSEPKVNEFDAAVAADAAHQRGFDHGRRWAAEEVLRIAAEEIRLQSSWLWHALGEERLTEVAALFGRRLIREMEHPAAPSEPVPDGPRVWELPVVPADVGRLTDADGETWYRCGPRHWQPATTHRDYGEAELIARRGPVTEVTDAP